MGTKFLFLLASVYLCAGVPLRKKRDAEDFCTTRSDGNYTDPQNKQSYIQCSNGTAVVKNCSDSHCFNSTQGSCAYCNATTSSANSTATTTASPETASSSSPDTTATTISSSESTETAATSNPNTTATTASSTDLASSNPNTTSTATVNTDSASTSNNNTTATTTANTEPASTANPVAPGAASTEEIPSRDPTTTSLPEINNFCANRKHGDMQVHPQDKHSFIQCSHGLTYVHNCPKTHCSGQGCSDRLCFDHYKKVCNYCNAVRNPPTTSATSPASTETPATLSPEIKDFCVNRTHGDMQVHPQDKHSFIQCSNGLTYVHNCPKTHCSGKNCPRRLCFDQGKRVCNYCNAVRNPPTTSATSPASTETPATLSPEIKDFCSNEKHGSLHRHPQDKHSFIQCSHRITYVHNCPKAPCFHRDCPTRLCFDQEKSVCNYCNAVRNPPSRDPSPPREEVTTTASPDIQDFCNTRSDGNYTNPQNRQSYIECSNGTAIVKPCTDSHCVNATITSIPETTEPASTSDPDTTATTTASPETTETATTSNADTTATSTTSQETTEPSSTSNADTTATTTATTEPASTSNPDSTATTTATTETTEPASTSNPDSTATTTATTETTESVSSYNPDTTATTTATTETAANTETTTTTA